MSDTTFNTTDFSQEDYADLFKYIPKSDTVKMVIENMLEKKIENWNEEIMIIANNALDGDVNSLMILLEITYLNAHNEGMIEGTNG